MNFNCNCKNFELFLAINQNTGKFVIFLLLNTHCVQNALFPGDKNNFLHSHFSNISASVLLVFVTALVFYSLNFPSIVLPRPLSHPSVKSSHARHVKPTWFIYCFKLYVVKKELLKVKCCCFHLRCHSALKLERKVWFKMMAVYLCGKTSH